MKLFVDDVRDAPDDTWVVARTADEAVKYLSRHNVTEVSLDHDLGEDSKSGYWVACVIENRTYYDKDYCPPDMKVHSANPVGRKNIEACINNIIKIKDIKPHVTTDLANFYEE